MTELRIRIVPSLAEVEPRASDACAGARDGGPLPPAVKVTDRDIYPPNYPHEDKSQPIYISRFLVLSGTVRLGRRPHRLAAAISAGGGRQGRPAQLRQLRQEPFAGRVLFDHGWADAFERAGGEYYPKLQVAVPFTPVPGGDCSPGPAPAGRRCAAGSRRARRMAGERIVVRPCHLLQREEWAARAGADSCNAPASNTIGRTRLRRVRGFPRRTPSRKRKAIRNERKRQAPAAQVAWFTGGD